MGMKTIIILLLFIIIYCLASAAFYMVRGKSNSHSMVKALTWRISLSIFLFILLLIGYFMGWITPHNSIE
jgi:TRAP-type C4-dicarboxylate transport system permease large subunit